MTENDQEFVEIETTGELLPARLIKALLAAQKDMPAVDRDGVNPHFNSRFVTLGNLIAKVRPVLNAHGIVFAQFPSSEGGPTLTTILMHESGEQLSYTAPLILTKEDPQAQGSAITYMRRYALAAALGISDQEDDDGNAASSPQSVEEEPMGFSPGKDGKHKQRTYFESLLNARAIPDDDVKRISAFANETLTRKRISAAIDALKDEEKSEATASYLFDEMVAWEAKQTSLPVDDADLPPAESVKS